MNDSKEEIKNKLDVVEVVGGYVKLQKAGVNYRACCPFHKEKTPSFYVSPQRQIAHCFGCGFSGDIFGFVMKIENVDFLTALKILANKAGVDLSRFQTKENSIKKTLFEIQEAALSFFERKLTENKEAYEYLIKRGLTKETIKEFRIGFAPDEWRSLTDHLVQLGFKLADIEKTGVIVRKADAINVADPNSLPVNFFFDRFRSRIMFPIFNLSQEPVGFTGRIFQADKNIPLHTIKNIDETGKYVNSPETIIFNKGGLLFLLNKTKNAILEKNEAILVEGQMDAISCFQEGLRNVVATSGTALTPDQLNILKRYCNSLILAYDNDEAGQEATERNIELALNAEFDIKIITLTDAKDFSDFINLHPGKLTDILSTAKPIMEFYFNRAKTLFDTSDNKGKRDFMNYFLSKIKYLKNNILERSSWVEKLASFLNVKLDLIENELQKSNTVNPYKEQYPTKEENLKNDDALKTREEILSEKIIAGLLQNQETLKDLVFENIQYFPPSFTDILELIKNNEIQNPALDYLWLLGSKDSLCSLEEITNCLWHLKKEHFKSRMNFLQNKIKELDNSGSKGMLQELMQEFKNLSEELNNG